MSSDKMREEFQKWKGYPLPEINSDGQYDKEYLQREWLAWKASRATLVIELPEPFWPGYIEDDGDTAITADLFTCAQVKDAIHAAGVKTP